MRKRSGVLLMAACVITSGCITGFKHPLGPPEEGFIEPRLLGTWACTSTDDPKPSLITFIDFDGKQYYIQSAGDGEGDPSHSRAFATRIEDVPFLNVRDLGPKAENDWTFIAYAVPDADHLRLRLVDPQPFEDVVDDPPSVKQRLANQLQDPELLLDWVSCTRPEVGKRAAH